jgi:hypothetical protein
MKSLIISLLISLRNEHWLIAGQIAWKRLNKWTSHRAQLIKVSLSRGINGAVTNRDEQLRFGMWASSHQLSGSHLTSLTGP